MWLENPLQIKRSTGIKRDKNDRTDSRDIALYAYRYQDIARCCQLPEAALQLPALLLSFRERLLQNFGIPRGDPVSDTKRPHDALYL
jgi:transposase